MLWLRTGCRPIAAGSLPDLLRQFHELHPQVDVTVKISDYLEDNLLKLTRGEIDFLIILDEPNAFPEFKHFAEKTAPIIFVTHPANQLKKKKTCRISDILESDFIVCDRGIGYSAILERKLLDNGLQMPSSMDVGSVEAIIGLLCNPGRWINPIMEEFIRIAEMRRSM